MTRPVLQSIAVSSIAADGAGFVIRIESNRIESTIERAKFSERSQRGRRPALGKRCRILFPLGNAAVQIGAPTIALVTYGSIP